MSVTTLDIETVLQKSKPRPPGKCHTLDHRGFALCGAFRSTSSTNVHTRRECEAQGHRHCVVCDELNRQLGDDWLVA